MTPTQRIQRSEGALIFIASIWMYHLANGNWLLFAALLLVFDVSMVGYLKNPKLGALVYNIGHSLVVPGAIAVYSLVLTGSVPAWLYIWFAHIGLDRMFGYGLKEPTSFKHTHLGHIGKSSKH